ncbi:hypothetical protein [Streptomyces sp. RKAG337]|uniref:hypothetical protein n=1 Tax=Streptomyces sp. RKAG337 TaxID=2893404 RepID=UPI0020339D54|nr:hypothetical protein [Streptomyces sp. RKAG337]MCM2430602.1 hypothetical protein [Streptomyces sp. RKAG337]
MTGRAIRTAGTLPPAVLRAIAGCLPWILLFTVRRLDEPARRDRQGRAQPAERGFPAELVNGIRVERRFSAHQPVQERDAQDRLRTGVAPDEGFPLALILQRRLAELVQGARMLRKGRPADAVLEDGGRLAQVYGVGQGITPLTLKVGNP